MRWIEGEITRVMEVHTPSLGYSIALCRTVARGRVLQDPQGWLASPRAKAGGTVAQHGVTSENGNNRTLSSGKHPEQPELAWYARAILPPDIVAGEVDVFTAQR